VKYAELEDVLKQVLKDLPLKFEIEDKSGVSFAKTASTFGRDC